jgi:hypothetical protein
VAAKDTNPTATLQLGDMRSFQEANPSVTEQDLEGQLVDIDQPTSSTLELAPAVHSKSEESEPRVLLAQSTEPARTLNVVQTAISQ